MPASASLEPRDIGTLMSEFAVPLVFAATVGAVVVGQCRALDYAVKDLWILPILLAGIAELAMYLSLFDPAPWCSNPFGYVASVSAYAGSIDRQGQTFLLLLLFSLLLASCTTVQHRHQRHRADTGRASYSQMCISLLMSCDLPGLRAYVSSTGWREPLTHLGEVWLLLGALCAVVTGVFPFQSGYDVACPKCILSELNDWHSSCIKTGVALALVGILVIFFQKVCELGRGNLWASFICVLLLLVVVLVCVLLWSSPQMLPPYVGVRPGISSTWLCFKFWQQDLCEPPSYDRREWRCAWRNATRPPLHPCIEKTPVSPGDPTPLCQFYGIANNRSTLWEIHLITFAALLGAGALAYVEHFDTCARGTVVDVRPFHKFHDSGDSDESSDDSSNGVSP